MKAPSISDVVFFMVASTICYLATVEKLSSEQFLNIASMVFAAYYVHKAQNKNSVEPNADTSITNP